MSTDKIIDKIRKIIAKADGTTHPSEAETFMAKAHAMLEAHNLSLLDLADATAADADEIGTTDDLVTVLKSSYWAKALTFSLAQYFGCRAVLLTRGNHLAFCVTGRESARVTFELMHPYIMRQVRAQGRELSKTGKASSPSAGARAVGNALTDRVNFLIWEERKKEEARVESGCRALVPVDAVKAAEAERFPELRTVKSRPKTTTAAARDAADRVSLSHQMTSDKKVARIA